MPEINLPAELEKIKEVSAGDSLLAVNSSDRHNAIRNALIGLSQGANIKTGGNQRKRTGPTWVMLSAESGGSNGQSVIPSDPFTCSYGGTDPESGTQTGVFVNVKKGTVNDRDEASGMTVTGESTSPPSGFWHFSLGPNVITYLMEMATIQTDGVVSAVEIYLDTTPDVTPAGDSGTGDPPGFAYRKIARLATDGFYELTITQYTTGAQQAIVAVSDWSCATIAKVAFWLP